MRDPAPLVSSRRAGRIGLTVLALAALGACASGKPPEAEMSLATTSVDRASAIPATASAAPVDMQRARDKLGRAQRAMADKDYDLARRLAAEAEVDAQLAESKAAAARNEQALAEVRRSVQALNDELNRRGVAPAAPIGTPAAPAVAPGVSVPTAPSATPIAPAQPIRPRY